MKNQDYKHSIYFNIFFVIYITYSLDNMQHSIQINRQSD